MNLPIPTNSKRLLMVYIVIFLWIFFASLMYFNINEVNDFKSLSIFFLSLTGFIMSYIWGESVRKSTKTTMLKPGYSSKREKLTYLIMLLWAVVGIFSIIKPLPLIDISTYFGALTPFVGSYIIGETYKISEK
ncbi:MAG: hypothetical protein WDA02_06725 [Saccharofermentanales bacterium]